MNQEARESQPDYQLKKNPVKSKLNHHYESEEEKKEEYKTAKKRAATGRRATEEILDPEEQLQEESYEDFSRIAKHANFTVNGQEGRVIQGQLVKVMKKLAKQTNTTFDAVFDKLCEKISDEKKKEDFVKYIHDWFEHEERELAEAEGDSETSASGLEEKKGIKVVMTYPGLDGQEAQHVMWCDAEAQLGQ